MENQITTYKKLSKIIIAKHIKIVYNHYVSVTKKMFTRMIFIHKCISISLVSRELLSLQGFFLSED